jgi:phosphate transport system permease protein
MNSDTYRQTVNRVMLGACTACAVLACAVLFYLLLYVFFQGVGHFNLDFFANTPKPLGETGGGVKNSIMGTLIIVSMATVVGIPVGLLIGIFVSEYASPRVGYVIRFIADVLTGVPSIVVGLFIYALIVLRQGHFSGFAGAAALAVIMIPIVARASEEMLKLVPGSQREAALALGIPQWRGILQVVLPAARRGLITASLLAIARASGETAPLMFTTLGNRFYSTDPSKEMDALPLMIFRYAIGPYDDWHEQAWTGAFVLVMLVLILSIFARVISADRRRA